MGIDDFRVGSGLNKLLAGRARPHKAFDLEVVRADGRATVRLAVRALTADEAMRAHADAIKWLVSTGGWQREDLIGDAGDAILNLEVMVQSLARALVDPDKPDTAFAVDAAEIRKLFEVDEIRACWDEYSAWSKERSPFRELKTVEEVREIVDALGKGLASLSSLPRYEYDTLRRIITGLVAQRATWTTESFLATSPQIVSDDSSPAESTPTMTIDEG